MKKGSLTKGKVVVIGSSNTDLILETDKLPKPGETILGAKLHIAHGGKGANQAQAARKMGADVIFAGRIGRDVYGDMAYESLKSEGIDVSHVQRDSLNASGIAVVMLDRKGRNAILVAPGSNFALNTTNVERVPINPGDVVLVQHEVPMDCVARAILRGYEAGARVVLNPAPAARHPDHVLSLVDWIIPNEMEAAALTHLPVNTPSQISAAARKLASMGPKNVIITLGSKGAWLHSAGFDQLVPAYDVKKVVDTTAAGDAFVGAFAARLSQGESGLKAIGWGLGAAALAITKLGAQPGMFSWQKIQRFVRAKGKRTV